MQSENNLCAIFLNDDGTPAVLFPTHEAIEIMSIREIAAKDIPFGKPFKIVPVDSLPQDKPQHEWEIDPLTLTDGIGMHGFVMSAQGDANG